MNEGSDRPRGGARGWPYIVTGALFAGICAWISYDDGLFVARLAGNRGVIAYAYPLLPDGLIVLALVALAEAARAGADRSRWAVAGLVLGAGATLAQNTGAGVAHSALDAVLDGLIPVFFFIAVEIVLWHVRHGRQSQVTAKELTVPGAVPSSAVEAARASMKATADAGNPWSQNQLQGKFSLTRAQAREVWAEFAPQRRRGGPFPSTTGAAPAAHEHPAGVNPLAPAGAELHLNGKLHG